MQLHAADVPSVSDFVPNPMNHVRIYGRKRFNYPCPYFFQTFRKRWNKICLNRIPSQKSLGVLNQDILVAKLSFHHVQSKQSPCD